MVMGRVVEEPMRGSVGQSGKSEIRGFGGMRVIPFGHELQATLSLTLPESDYNKNLGLFEVGVRLKNELNLKHLIQQAVWVTGSDDENDERKCNPSSVYD
ncbi:seipin-2-like protein isoform X1 [Tanacetum coccineum]|uniref:Seipin-2-like protein isoform X1 n=1 Tax=Tanacetum coccineum TaxID=301880 RepID=A0ABQ4Y0I3_9ASTR